MTDQKKILLIDDNHELIDTMKLLLEKAGFQVTSVDDPSLIRSMLKISPHVILLDLFLPGIDGVELCKELKTDVETKHIPLILISASTEIEDSAGICGADDFIAKPFTIKNLIGKINKHVN